MVLSCQICLADRHKNRRSFVTAKLENMESSASGCCFVSDSCHFNSSSVVKTFGWSMWSNSSLGSVLLLTGGWSERAVAGKLRRRGRRKTWQVGAACGNGGAPFQSEQDVLGFLLMCTCCSCLCTGWGRRCLAVLGSYGVVKAQWGVISSKMLHYWQDVRGENVIHVSRARELSKQWFCIFSAYFG